MHIILLILAASFFIVISFGLGHFVSIKNEVFLNNYFAKWIIGVVSYLVIMFIVALPLLLMPTAPNVVWFVVLFFVKDGILLLFLFYQRQLIFKNINYVDTAWIIVGGIIFSVFFAYVISTTHKTAFVDTNSFSAWNSYLKTLNWFGEKLNNPIVVRKIVAGFIVGTIGYSVIASIFVNAIRGNGVVERIVSVPLSILLIYLFNFGVPIEYQIGSLLLFFLIIVGIRLILYSRRRYGALFGILSFIIWSTNHFLLIAIVAIALTTIIVYTYRVRPKPSLFFVQLIAPLLMMTSLQLYSENSIDSQMGILAFVLFFLSGATYIYIITARNKTIIERFDNFLLKYRILVPAALMLIVLSGMILVIFEANTYDWGKLETITQPLLSVDIISTQQWIQPTIFYGILVSVGALITYWVIAKKQFDIIKMFLVFILLTILLLYNPIMEKGMSWTSTFYPGYAYLKLLILPILMIVATTKTIMFIKNRTT